MTLVEARSRRDLFTTALLVGAVLLAYANALGGPFQYDDWWQIVDRPMAHGLPAWWQSLPGVRPLLKLSFALNWMASPAPLGFHVVNIVLHAINALLVWALARRWLARLAPGLADPGRASFVTALIFALHPAATEAVTYISGRSMSLMATFFLASMWTRETADDRRWRRLLSPLLFALALAVRETAAILPLVLLWLTLCSGHGWRAAFNSIRPQLAVLLAANALVVATPGYRHFFAASFDTRGLVEQLLGQARAHAYLVSHPLFGLDTNIDPDLLAPARADSLAVAVWIALLALVALAWASRRRWPWLGFGIGWYLLQLLPSNSFIPRFDLANDRHLYLALIGPALILAVFLVRLGSSGLQTVLVLALAATLATATIRRNQDYRSELALWQETVRSSPGKARPWVNLGYARQQAGDLAGAAEAYRCAQSESPGDVQATNNLALMPAPWPQAQAMANDCRPP